MRTPLIRGSYFQDLLEQPLAVRRTCDALRAGGVPAMRAARFRRVVLTGMGSSLHALYPLHRRLGAAGVVSQWVETAELVSISGGNDAEALVVAVSQSGESAEIVQLLRSGRRFGHVVGVTNAADSTLARNAGTVVLLQAGLEATVSCKTYVATLAALHWLGAVLLDETVSAALEPAAAVASDLARYLERAEPHVEELAEWVRDSDSVFVVGRGNSLATAGTGGLILKESTRRQAEGMSAAAFRHGPLEMAGPRVLVLVMAGDERSDPLNRRLAADFVLAGGRAAVVSRHAPTAAVFQIPVVADPLLPMVEILPVQMLSLAIAARDGREAGRFQHASKITTIA